jgi:hypothetical protein
MSVVRDPSWLRSGWIYSPWVRGVGEFVARLLVSTLAMLGALVLVGVPVWPAAAVAYLLAHGGMVLWLNQREIGRRPHRISRRDSRLMPGNRADLN